MERVKSSKQGTMMWPTQRTSRDPGDVKLLSLFVTECMLAATVIVLSALLLAVILSQGRLRRDLFKQCLVSLAAGGAIFSLLARPGAIHEDTTTSILTDTYCGFYLTVLDVESIMVTYTLFAMTVERIIAVSEPMSYSKRFNSIGRAALLAFPWVFGLLYGLIRTFGLTDGIIAHYGAFPDDAYYNKHSELAAGQCMLIFYNKSDAARLIIGDLIATEVPAIALIISSLVLIILYCRHQRATQGSHNLDLDLDRPVVQRGSIVVTLVLNFVLLVAVVSDFIFTTTVATWGNSHWKICVVELLVAMLSLSCLPDVRGGLDKLFCCHDNANDREVLITVTSSDADHTSQTMPESDQQDSPPY